MENVKPQSVIDLGCGTGKSLDYFLQCGVDAIGVEGSKLAISKAKHRQRIIRWNLEKELQLGRRFDLLYSYEVLEHIHGDFADNVVRSCVAHSDLLILTAARPGQGGEGHFNEQPPEYWINRFQGHGYYFDEKMTAALKATCETHAENAMVFRRADGKGKLEDLGSLSAKCMR
jgi:SAM-dependent methyltransferase